jgi:hypothetical protein
MSVEESWYLYLPVLTREFPQGPTDEETLRSVCPFGSEIAGRIASKGLTNAAIYFTYGGTVMATAIGLNSYPP